MLKNKKASIFIFILILINVILILWYVVFNNVTVINNNIDIWKNAEEVFKNVQQKWNINIKTDLQYNSNWDWFADFISCPTNVTMSWSTDKSTWILTEMHYSYWSYYCLWKYNWKEFRIFFDKNTHDFNRAYYEWDIVNLIIDNWNNKWSNLAPWSTVTASTRYSSSYDKSYAYDDIVDSKYYKTKKRKYTYIKFELDSEKELDSIEFYKKKTYWRRSSRFDTADIDFYDSSNHLLDSTNLVWMRDKTTFVSKDLRNLSLWNKVKYVKITENSWNKQYLNFKEIKIYEAILSWSKSRKWEREFNDSDNTLISFDDTWVGWWDNFDDNFNSDDYKVGSTWSINYPGWFQDDDVIPRLTIFWDVRKGNAYQNIFWSNYKTNDFVENNTNNNDSLNLKIWDITDGNIYLDFFSDSKDIKYDLKVYQFDRNAFKDENTLLLIKSYKIDNLTMNSWYIQLFNWELWLSTTRTSNTMSFDFKNNDYAIFVINKLDSNLSYRITWESSTGTWVYINPIDDSATWTIKSLSNHIIIWDEKNFIWEQFVIVWNK
jgi:hypothetical protein